MRVVICRRRWCGTQQTNRRDVFCTSTWPRRASSSRECSPSCKCTCFPQVRTPDMQIKSTSRFQSYVDVEISSVGDLEPNTDCVRAFSAVTVCWTPTSTRCCRCATTRPSSAPCSASSRTPSSTTSSVPRRSPTCRVRTLPVWRSHQSQIGACYWRYLRL